MNALHGDALLHPVRLRIVQTLVQRPMTTAQVQQVLADVAQATLYRHMSALEDAGLIEVVDRRQVRGSVERTFAVVEGAASLDADDVQGVDPPTHMRWFTTFVATLLADMAAYLDDDGIDLEQDRVGYRQTPLWLTDAEVDDLVGDLRAVVARRTDLPPAPGRRRRLLSTILIADHRAETGTRHRATS